MLCDFPDSKTVECHSQYAHDDAEFVDDSTFRLKTNPFGQGVPLGHYELLRRPGETHLYRMTHPLAEAVLACAKSRVLPPAAVRLTYSDHAGKITVLEPLVGKSGWLTVYRLSIEFLDQPGDHLISERNARIFEAEIEKLEGWADDLKLGLEREIKELDRQIKEARRAAVAIRCAGPGRSPVRGADRQHRGQARAKGGAARAVFDSLEPGLAVVDK